MPSVIAWIAVAVTLAASPILADAQQIVWEPTYGPERFSSRLRVAPDGSLYAVSTGLYRYNPRERAWQRLPLTTAVNDVGFLGGAVFAAIDTGVVRMQMSPGPSWAEAGARLQNVRAWALASAGGSIFAGTTGGVFRLTEGSTEWERAGISRAVTSITSAGSVLFATRAIANTTIRSGNGGKSWREVWDTRIARVAVVGEAFYAWDMDGSPRSLLRSDDRGVTWTAIADPPLRFVSDLVAGDGTLYTYDSHAGVWRSTDLGLSWDAMNEGLLGLGVNAIAVSPTDIFAAARYHAVYRASLLPPPAFDPTEPERRAHYRIPEGMSLYSAPLHATRIASETRTIDITRAGGALMAHHLIQLGSSVVISLDGGQFRTAIGRDGVLVFGEDFVIEPSRGYVVNALAPIDVTLDGYPHGTAIEAPDGALPGEPHTWAFVVAGHVDSDSVLPAGTRLRVSNTRTEQTVLAELEDGRVFSVAFTDLAGGEVVDAGDVLELALLSRDGVQMGAPRLARVGTAELRQAHVLISMSGRPSGPRLLPNYPNPFNPETWIPFQLMDIAPIVMVVYDLRGRQVRRIDMGVVDAGFHLDRDQAVRWDGRNDVGESVGSGAYFVEMRTPSGSDLRRVTIAR